MQAKTTTKNKKVLTLISKAFNNNGYLIDPDNEENQNEAKKILDGKTSFYGQKINGCDTHTCLLIIAYPSADI